MSIAPLYQIMTNLNCNLDCHYCYEQKTGKQNTVGNVRTFLASLFKRDEGNTGPVLIDLIGGEPLLFPELCRAAMEVANELAVKYGRSCVHGSVSSNGTLFGNPDVRSFIEDYRRQLNVGVSIDGTREMHDRHRVFKSSPTRGSYDQAVENLPWLFDTVGRRNVTCKHTLTPEAVPTMADGYFNLVDLGFAKIIQNFTFEDAYDLDCGMLIFEQLKTVMDHWAGEGWYNSIEYSEITDKTPIDYLEGLTLPLKDEERNMCGTCKHMNCLGFDGEVYGCNRFLTMNQPGNVIGSLDHAGQTIDYNKTGFLEEVQDQWKIKASDPVCGSCRLRNECSHCAARPYEAPEGVEAFMRSRNMCGWTHALGLARIYSMSLMKIYEAEHGNPPDRFVEAGLFMGHSAHGPQSLKVPDLKMPGA